MPDSAQYPTHLPPNLALRYISVAQQAAQSRYVVRTTKDAITYDTDGLITASLVMIPGSKQLLDYSVNLLGTFQLIDRAWRTDHLTWQPGQPVQPTTSVQYNELTDWYALTISRLHQQWITCAAVPGETLQCYVCHDPTHANYWHFVIRFADEKGINVKSLALTNGPIKRMMADLRAWMREMIGRHPQLLSEAAIIPIRPAYCRHIQPDYCP